MSEFKVGDVVKIVGAADGQHKKWNDTEGFHNVWIDAMTGYIGGVCEIEDITLDGVTLAGCGGYKFPPQALELCTEKTKISKDKKYRTVDMHYPVRIICKDRKDSLPWVGLYTTYSGVEGVFFVKPDGTDLLGEKLIEEVPDVDWSKVKIDTPIWVKFPGKEYNPRHFAFDQHDHVAFYADGCTSHTGELVFTVSKNEALLSKPNEKA